MKTLQVSDSVHNKIKNAHKKTGLSTRRITELVITFGTDFLKNQESIHNANLVFKETA